MTIFGTRTVKASDPLTRLWSWMIFVFLLAVSGGPAMAQAKKDKAMSAPADTLSVPATFPSPQHPQTAQTLPADTARVRPAAVSVRTNLAWDAVAEPNLAVDVQVGDHVSLGVAGGLKPWPRWLFGDWDNSGNNTHWRNFAIVPQARWWPRSVYDGWFIAADFVYTHFNVGAVRFPFGIYPEVRDSRVQGSFWGAGLAVGHSWRLGGPWRLELEAGVAGGQAAYDRYDCPHCGTRLGHEHKAAVVPKVGVNIVWNPEKKDKSINK